MKKQLIVIAMILMSMSCYSQNRKSYSDNNSSKTGLYMTIGGVFFSTAGFLTPANYTSTYSPNNTSNYNFTNHTVPFFQQGPRATCIVAGVTLTFTGLITMAAKK